MIPVPRAASTIEGLDLVLGGGFPVDRLYLVEGDPGTGKTTLALQFLLEGVRQGEGALYVTLSETEQELRAVAPRTAGRWTASRSTSSEPTRACDPTRSTPPSTPPRSSSTTP
jgi:KaiC/GvpD/RAD55 family RecA-like ATPase